jgi:hypothetical protein
VGFVEPCAIGSQESCLQPRASELPAVYACLLGAYLGDGTISRHRRNVWKLRIFCNAAQDLVIDEFAGAIELFTSRPAGLMKRSQAAVVEVSSYSKHWTCALPQHGPGRKHTRSVALAPWQAAIVREEPRPFVRALLHSDGCRILNRVYGREYPRYFFSNRSAQIHEMLREALDQLGIRWTASRWDTTSIARRNAVAALDDFVGPKRSNAA